MLLQHAAHGSVFWFLVKFSAALVMCVWCSALSRLCLSVWFVTLLLLECSCGRVGRKQARLVSARPKLQERNEENKSRALLTATATHLSLQTEETDTIRHAFCFTLTPSVCCTVHSIYNQYATVMTSLTLNSEYRNHKQISRRSHVSLRHQWAPQRAKECFNVQLLRWFSSEQNHTNVTCKRS